VQGIVRRLKDLVHSLRPQCALDQVADGDGSYECGETRILTLLLRDIVRKDLSGVRLKAFGQQINCRSDLDRDIPSCKWW
jgi:hypothetical protein